MLPENILKSDVLDIVFENRNKTYGAYHLRKTYPQRVKIALIAVTVLCSVLALMSFTKSNTDNGALSAFFPTNDTVIIDLIAPPVQKPVPVVQQPQQVKPRTAVASTDYQTFRIVKDDFAKQPLATVDQLENTAVSNVTAGGDPSAFGNVQPIQNPANAGGLTNGGGEEEPEIFVDVQVMPSFPGGVNALRKYLERNLAQPDDLIEGEKIVVQVRFVLNAEGNVEQAEIVKSGRPDLDENVVKVVQHMPRWNPGIQNGRKVAVYYVLPVTFVGQ